MGSFNDLMGLYNWMGNKPDQSMEDLRKNRLRKEAEKSLKTSGILLKSPGKISAPKNLSKKKV